jgi:ribonuclease P protein component
VKRSFRLTSTTDFKRVRRFGKSYAHPLLVLVALPESGEQKRIGIAASRSVGKAVDRNRAKRLVREAARSQLTSIQPGWIALIICRRPVLNSSLPEIIQAMSQLLDKAGMLKNHDGI